MKTLIATPRFDALVGIDSDGCVFDSMRIKQCIHFHPLIIQFWDLQAVEKPFRACAEFVNLTSQSRGSNRFVALIREFELLKTYPGIDPSAFRYPDFTALKRYLNSGVPLGNPTLKQAVAASDDLELARVYAWSLAVDAEIHANMQPVPPFAGAVKALQMMQNTNDVVVISQTPEQALNNEWKIHNIRRYVSATAGLEFGSKTEQLCVANQGRYLNARMMMIGDAMGDLAAAQNTQACFFPIMPDHEEASWEQFCTEAYPRFLDNTYVGAYQDARIAEFRAALPEVPPWQMG